MRILGIDPGTGRTGWGVISAEEKDRIEYIAHGCVSTPTEDLMQDRLLALYKELQSILKQFTPEVVVVEQIFFGINARTAISVSQARGVVMLSAAEVKLPIFEYSPPAVKLLLSGHGKTEKKEMKTIVRRLLSKNNRTLSFSAKDRGFDDAADGLAIAIHHAWKITGKSEEILARIKEEKKILESKLRKKKLKNKKQNGVVV